MAGNFTAQSAEICMREKHNTKMYNEIQHISTNELEVSAEKEVQ